MTVDNKLKLPKEAVEFPERTVLDYRPETTLTGISVEDRWVTVRYRTAEDRIGKRNRM